MLVGALRSDNPLGGAALTCDDATEAFALQGVGEISAAKLLDLENRRQLVWSDLVTREWVLETAAIRVRRQTAARTAAAASVAEAAESARAETGNVPADGRAEAGAHAPGGHTLVFEPPASAGSSGPAGLPTTSAPVPQPPAARRPAGVPAATTRFAVPVDDGRVAGRLVWSETLPDDGAAPGDCAAPREGAASDEGATPSEDAASGEVAYPSGAPDRPRQAGASGHAAVARRAEATVTRRVDRRRSLQKAEQRRRLSTGLGRGVVVALFAVATVVLVLVVQHGGF